MINEALAQLTPVRFGGIHANFQLSQQSLRKLVDFLDVAEDDSHTFNGEHVRLFFGTFHVALEGESQIKILHLIQLLVVGFQYSTGLTKTISYAYKK